MKKLRIFAKPLFLLVFVGAMTVTFASVAADCCQASSTGCFDRYGTFIQAIDSGPGRVAQ